MVVNELCELFVDAGFQNVKIYDISKDSEIVFEGKADDIPQDLEYLDVHSIDNLEQNCVLGINIDSED